MLFETLQFNLLSYLFQDYCFTNLTTQNNIILYKNKVL